MNGWECVKCTLVNPELAPVCRSVWEWMMGDQEPENIASLQQGCHDNIQYLREDIKAVGPGSEALRVNAAFQLARGGWAGTPHPPLPRQNPCAEC